MELIYGGDPEDPQQQLINKGLGTFYRAKFAHDIADRAINRFFPTQREELQDEDMRLSIAQRKRAMGIPLDDEDYQYAVNNEIPFKTMAPTLFGPEVEQLIPSPGFLKNTARVARPNRSILRTVFQASSGATNDGSTLRTIAKYARAAVL